MERKKFLEACQRFSIYGDVSVLCNGVEYYPKSYKLWFDENGNSMHNAELLDKNKNSIICCKLSEVEEVEKKD